MGENFNSQLFVFSLAVLSSTNAGANSETGPTALKIDPSIETGAIMKKRVCKIFDLNKFGRKNSYAS